MFQNAKSLRSLCFRGFGVHSLKTSDKVLRYGKNNQVEFSEYPIVVQRGNERIINIYAAIPDVAWDIWRTVNHTATITLNRKDIMFTMSPDTCW